MIWALLPLKDLVQAKTRLAGILAPFERRALAQAMVEDVLSVLSAHDQIAGALLVSDDSGADLLARKYQADLLPESSLDARGLNAVLTSGRQALAARGVEHVAIVHCDLPLLTGEAVSRLIDKYLAPDVDVLLSPDRRERGTNVLLTSTTRYPTLCYGIDSCQRHEVNAATQGLRAIRVQEPSVALDVDYPADLLDVSLASGVGEYTARFLAQDSIRRRLAVMIEAAQSALHAEGGDA
ncbi:MAG: 2-phospho-L-lactate guanylyltransferase [Pseudomonadota bacterium]